MNQRKIFVTLTKDQIPKVKSLLKVLKFTISKINLDNMNFNDFDDKTILSFSFNGDYYNDVLERLALNKIEVMVTDEQSQKIVDEAERKLNKKESIVGVGLLESSSSKKSKPLISLIEAGDYEELIRISQSVTEEKIKIERAKANIKNALKILIEQSYSEGMKDKYKTKKCFNKLIKVSTNTYLRKNFENNYGKEAGLLAINLAVSDGEFYNLLIHMANNSSLPPEISIKAFLKFYVLAIENKSPNSKFTKFAINECDEKYLKFLYESNKNKLSKNEKLTFAKFVTFLRKERNKK